MERPRRIVPLVVLGQLLVLGTWFAGTAALPGMRAAADLGPLGTALLLAAVQLGFVLGTLAFAILHVADRFPAPRVFLASALAAAASNAILLLDPDVAIVALARVLTGISLAGVYPIGMKILASWDERPGRSLGFLVAALTLGSGSPYLVRAAGAPWTLVIATASTLAILGALLVGLFVPAGPRLPTVTTFQPRAFATAFRSPAYRRAAFAYFGHMWELYALWGLLPLALVLRPDIDIPLAMIIVFGAGALGAALGGILSRTFGETRIGTGALALSGILCLISPILLVAPQPILLLALAIWGAAVIADSAQWSALCAEAAPRHAVGTALTLQNAIGFAITFGSLSLTPLLASLVGWRYALLALAIGPILGVIAALAPIRESVPS